MKMKKMKLFVDTGNVEEVRKAAEWGILDGVTTNPSLIAKSGNGLKNTVLQMCEILPQGHISAEVVAAHYDEMLKEALEVASWHPNVVVKVPMTPEGIKLVRTLSEKNIKTNVTLVFSLSQVLLAAKAGATYISSFVGRVDDISGEGMTTVGDAVDMIHHYGFESQIVVASIRHPLHVVESIRLGAHVATVPFKVMEMLFHHPLTENGLKRFLQDWKNAGLNIF
jgi:transaldolase